MAAMRPRLPGLLALGGALLLGFVSYGLSLVSFIVALRHLGTARTGAYYGTAPFIGASAATIILGTPLTGTILIAGLLMAFGAWLHLSEHHVTSMRMRRSNMRTGMSMTRITSMSTGQTIRRVNRSPIRTGMAH